MKVKANPYGDLTHKELGEVGLRSVRDAADGLREAANELKKAGDFGPEVRKELDEVSAKAKDIKARAGKQRGK